MGLENRIDKKNGEFMEKLMVREYLEYLTEQGDIKHIARLYEKYPELIEEETVQESEDKGEKGWNKLKNRLENSR